MPEESKRKSPYAPPLARRKAEQLERWTQNTGRVPGQGGQPGNVNGIKHGVFADRFMSESEREIFEEMMTRFHEEFILNRSADFVQLEFAGIYMLQLARAILVGDWETASKIDGLLRANLKDLKATKRTREGEGTPQTTMSPAEWATELLGKVARAKALQAQQEDIESEPAAPSATKTRKRVQRTPGKPGEEPA